MDLSFPGQRTATATSCIDHDNICMPGQCTGKSENGFFHCDTWLQIFQNDSKICEAEVTLTPLINKICKPCVTIIILLLFNYMIRFSNFHIVWRKAKAPGTVSRLERPGNFSGSKTNFKIKTCWILAESLAHKLVSFALSTDSFVVSFLKSLKRWSWIWCGKRG